MAQRNLVDDGAAPVEDVEEARLRAYLTVFTGLFIMRSARISALGIYGLNFAKTFFKKHARRDSTVFF